MTPGGDPNGDRSVSLQRAARLTGVLLLCGTLLGNVSAAGARPVVSVLAQNDGTEITDFLVPFAVIASSDAADVVAVSTANGPIELIPGPFLAPLEIGAETTTEAFDQVHPAGADFVIVPAFHDSENLVTRTWLRAQAAKSATLVSICDGALTLAATGLLDGHRATGHFASANQRRKQFPKVEWMTNTRYVHDGKFISSSGVSASLPTALYVVELLAGRTRALEVARAHGAVSYEATHDSDAFRLGTYEYWTAARNLLFGWPRDVYAIELTPAIDEVGLAFVFDMTSRTFFARTLTVAATNPVTTRHGLHVLRSATQEAVPWGAVSVRIGGPVRTSGVTIGEGARAPGDLLRYLTRRYGEPLSAFVATQLEYAPSEIN